MARLKLIKAPHPILNSVAEDITEFNQELFSWSRQMREIMKKKKGVGLAGNQVGLLKRIIIVQLSDNKTPLTLINPRYEVIGNKTRTSTEGCLSLPGKGVSVERANWILVRAKNLMGKDIELSVGGFDATIVQHEVDHLNGVLMDSYESTTDTEEKSL